MLKTSLGVVVVKDRYGNIAIGSSMLLDSPIFLGGLIADGESVVYNGIGHGVKPWAKRHGFEYEVHCIDLDLDSRIVLDWHLGPS